MKFKKKKTGILEGDLTPMIDMTFQLIAFFMLIINFSEVEKSEEINLPLSELAKPPEEPPPFKIVLNLDEDGSIKHGPQIIDNVDVITPVLSTQVGRAEREGVAVAEISVIIRADRSVDTGLVQRLMNKCKEQQLESFSLRVNESLR
ncbi:MAG: ExbD/TolR family protein [Pirellulaceae bacterium]